MFQFCHFRFQFAHALCSHFYIIVFFILQGFLSSSTKNMTIEDMDIDRRTPDISGDGERQYPLLLSLGRFLGFPSTFT